MEAPNWYPDWRHDAVHKIQEKNARLEAEFRLGHWPRFDYDIDAGTLTFSEQGVPKVVAEVQIPGTTSFRAGNWLWSWANSHLPAERVTDAEIVRAFGEKHGIRELTRDCIVGADLNALGWELTAVMVRVTDAVGAYRPVRNEGGGLYLTFRSIAWAG